MTTINPYLNFNGNCEEAFNFYKDVFGGELVDFQRFKDAPAEAQMQMPAQEAEWVMHVTLPIGSDTVLMGSDRPSAMGQWTQGNSYYISLQTTDTEETDRLFNSLSAGGQVTMPLHEMFWGARYGMFVDRFGVQWMVNQSGDWNASQSGG